MNPDAVYTIVAVPQGEPITVQQLRDQCRIDHRDEDTLLLGYIATGRAFVENFTNTTLMPTTRRLTVGCFRDRVELLHPPVQSVTSVKYRDTDGVEQTLDPAEYRMLNQFGVSFLKPAVGGSWPSTQTREDAVVVEYVAGYPSREDIPAPLCQAVALKAADLYEHRESVVIGSTVSTIDGHVENLISPYYVPELS